MGVTQSLNNPHITPNEPKEDTAGKREIARQSIDLLNRVANRSFRHTEKNIGHVMARLREGFTPADIQLAVEHKSAEWGGDSHMAQYLRPETLFGTKFESYLQAATAKQSGVIRDEKPKTALERLQANIDAAESTFSGAVISRDDGAPMDGARPHLRLGAVDKKLW